MSKTPRLYDLACGDHLRAVFIDRALERALRFGASEYWDTDLVTLDHLNRLLEGEVVFDMQSRDFEGLILDLQNAIVAIGLERSEQSTPIVVVDVHAGSRQAARLEMARLKELLPEAEMAASAPAGPEPIGFVFSHRRRS